MTHRSAQELEAGLAYVRDAPGDAGRLELIVRRPGPGEREILDLASLDLSDGLIGDNWRTRGSRLTPDGTADPAKQLNMSRFGNDAFRLVNSPVGRSLRLRGINARVLRPGTIRIGDPVRKVTVRVGAGAAW